MSPLAPERPDASSCPSGLSSTAEIERAAAASPSTLTDRTPIGNRIANSAGWNCARELDTVNNGSVVSPTCSVNVPSASAKAVT